MKVLVFNKCNSCPKTQFDVTGNTHRKKIVQRGYEREKRVNTYEGKNDNVSL